MYVYTYHHLLTEEHDAVFRKIIGKTRKLQKCNAPLKPRLNERIIITINTESLSH